MMIAKKPRIVIPDKESVADRSSGIPYMGAAKPHKSLDPVRVKLAAQVTNGMTDLHLERP